MAWLCFLSLQVPTWTTWHIHQVLGESSNVVVRKFNIGNRDYTNTALIFLDGMVDKKQINENILRPLMISNNTFRH
jgi:hypothetical protein